MLSSSPIKHTLLTLLLQDVDSFPIYWSRSHDRVPNVSERELFIYIVHRRLVCPCSTNSNLAWHANSKQIWVSRNRGSKPKLYSVFSNIRVPQIYCDMLLKIFSRKLSLHNCRVRVRVVDQQYARSIYVRRMSKACELNILIIHNI